MTTCLNWECQDSLRLVTSSRVRQIDDMQLRGLATKAQEVGREHIEDVGIVRCFDDSHRPLVRLELVDEQWHPVAVLDLDVIEFFAVRAAYEGAACSGRCDVLQEVTWWKRGDDGLFDHVACFDGLFPNAKM